MTYLGTKDFIDEVAKGNVAGHTLVTVNGHNDDATTTKVTVAPTLTTADITQSAIHSTAATVKIASSNANDTSAGTGLRTLKLEGLDSSGNAQSETITLNGQTEVTSSNTYSAINEFVGLTAGSGNKSAGDIWVGNGTFTSGVPATKIFVGEVEHNHGLTAYYTIPTGKTLFAQHIVYMVVGSNKEVELTLETSTDGDFWIIEQEFAGVSGTVLATPIDGLHSLAAGTHVRMAAEAAGSGSEVTVTFQGTLVDD